MEVRRTLLVLRPQPWKWIRILCTAMLFIAAGFFMTRVPHDLFRVRVGWASIIFFGLVAVVAALQLVPGRCELILTEEGLLVRAILRERFIAWSDIERFGVSVFRTHHGPFTQEHKQVALRYLPEAKALLDHRTSTSLSEAIGGFHSTLPDSYGYEHQELADLLNRYLDASRST